MTRTSDATGDLGWGAGDACTLPTADRPLRGAEFDALFATLHSVEHDGDTHARLLLGRDPALSGRARQLADEETACCSFFTFDVSTSEDGMVTLAITVPPAYAGVLRGLTTRAEALRERAS